MKRILACLLCVLLLAGCGAREIGEPSLPETEPSAEAGEGETAGIRMAMEWPVYGEGVTDLICMVTNETDTPLEFGLSYAVEHLEEDGTWRELPWKDGRGVNTLALVLEPQGRAALPVSLGDMEFGFTPGSYRVVKDFDGIWASARFDIGGSAVTPESPYGFGPLEDLPEDYGAAAAADSDVVFTGDGVQNEDLAEEFLYKVSLGVPCQLRTVQDYGEGLPMVIDVIYENGHFRWRMRSGGVLAELRFSYVVTDGRDLYLSNGASWETGERYGEKRTFLLPEGKAYSALLTLAEEMTARRLEGNSARYRVWSAGGTYSAALTETPTEFFVEGQGHGAAFDLQDRDGPETAILGLEWQEDGRLRLTCGTADDKKTALLFDPETESLTGR